MMDITECPICQNRDLQKFVSCKDYTVSHETFNISLCNNCKLGITTPRPETNKLGDYYKSDEYISHSGKSSGGLGSIYKIARSFSLNWKRGTISKFKNSGNLLDFGCGTGEFLDTMRKSGWSISGVEVSELARTKAEMLTRQKLNSSFDKLPENYFHVITAWHVVEHVPDLTQTLLKLKSLLQKDGIIFIAVPNYQSPDAEKYQEHWAGFDVPRHLWHFSKQSMNTLFQTAGLKIIDTIPMKLDAYYVSMLSEKYKNKNVMGFGSLLNGFLSGLKSNFKARNSTNHSSLIYVGKIHEA